MAWGMTSDNGLLAQINDANSTPRPTTIDHPAISARCVLRSYISWGKIGGFGFLFATYLRPHFKASRLLIAAAMIVIVAYALILAWLVIKSLT
jgi:hypothetical protein